MQRRPGLCYYDDSPFYNSALLLFTQSHTHTHTHTLKNPCLSRSKFAAGVEAFGGFKGDKRDHVQSPMKVTLCAVPAACLLTVEAAALIRLLAHRREGEALSLLSSATAGMCEPAMCVSFSQKTLVKEFGY